MAGCNPEPALAPDSEFTSSSSETYRRFERLRGKLLSHSLQRGITLSQIVQLCLEDLPSLLNFDLFSVYLLDRVGEMKRISAWRTSGGSLPELDTLGVNEWRSLVGWSANSLYCDPAVSRDEATPNDPLNRAYENATGKPLARILRLPLNGSSRTFGILEVAEERHGCGPATVDLARREFRRLLTVAATLANSITAWRSRNESFVLADVVGILAQADVDSEGNDCSREVMFNLAVQRLVAAMDEYRAAVLMIRSADQRLRVLAKAGDPSISWDTWHDPELESGQYLAGRVYEKRTAEVVEDMERAPHLFSNLDWIIHSHLKSCVCLPLALGGNCIGTLTVYTGFVYDFSDLDQSILVTLADSFALYWARLESVVQRNEAENELRQLQHELEERRVTEAREAAVLPMVSLLHQSKNSFIEILNKIPADPENSAVKAIQRIAEVGRDRLVQSEILDARSDDVFDVQEVIARIVRSKAPNWKRSSIKVSMDFGHLPQIKMHRSLFAELIYNLLSNAERAIRKANRDKGLIEISASAEQSKQSDDLVIRVRDNGIGVPRDKQDLIFERGFTTFAADGGTGLGLFLSQDIVQGYRGRIYVEASKVGEGTTFVVRLPLSWITD